MTHETNITTGTKNGARPQALSVSHDLWYNYWGQVNFDRVLPIVALVGDEIVADATLHRSRAMSQRYVSELWVVVDPSYRGVGLGRRLIRELLDIAVDLGLHKATFELVAQREETAIATAGSAGFREVASL